MGLINFIKKFWENDDIVMADDINRWEDGIDNVATGLNDHGADTVRHITNAERVAWNSSTSVATTAPLADNATAVVGTNATAARADHRHPHSFPYGNRPTQTVTWDVNPSTHAVLNALANGESVRILVAASNAALGAWDSASAGVITRRASGDWFMEVWRQRTSAANPVAWRIWQGGAWRAWSFPMLTSALSTVNPLAPGTAAPGTSANVARQDHRHPLQTTITGNAATATALAANRTISLTGAVTGSVATNLGGNASIATTQANLATATPLAPGTAAVGTGTRVAREDHRHAAQTTVSGNAGTATTLATARNINGTSFNGSANITTANWGTARNFTIGGTQRSVNGSQAMTWTLADIGAAPASIATDTGWQNIALASGITAVANRTPQARRVGNVIHIRGAVNGSGASVGTVPSGLRPVGQAHGYVVGSLIVGGGGSGTINQVQVTNIVVTIATGGAMTITNVGGSFSNLNLQTSYFNS